MAQKFKLDRGQVTEHEVFQFTAEASDLRWPPGFFPKVMETNLGNGLDLYLVSLTEEAAKYDQVGGCIHVTIYND